MTQILSPLPNRNPLFFIDTNPLNSKHKSCLHSKTVLFYRQCLQTGTEPGETSSSCVQSTLQSFLAVAQLILIKSSSEHCMLRRVALLHVRCLLSMSHKVSMGSIVSKSSNHEPSISILWWDVILTHVYIPVILASLHSAEGGI